MNNINTNIKRPGLLATIRAGFKATDTTQVFIYLSAPTMILTGPFLIKYIMREEAIPGMGQAYTGLFELLSTASPYIAGLSYLVSISMFWARGVVAQEQIERE